MYDLYIFIYIYIQDRLVLVLDCLHLMLQNRSKLASCTRTPHPSQNADSWFKDGISPSWKRNQLTAAKTQKHRSWKPEQCWFFQWNVPLKPWKKHVPQLERPNFLYILGVFLLLALDVCFSSFFVDIIVLIPCDLSQRFRWNWTPNVGIYRDHSLNFSKFGRM